MKKNLFLIILGVFSMKIAQSQEKLPLFVQQKSELIKKSWVKETNFEKLDIKNDENGINQIEISPKNSNEMLISSKDGGLWHSNNGGNNFTLLSKNLPSVRIFKFTINWENNHLWVSTNLGLFHSNDKGNSFIFKGLENYKNISSIVINEKNPDEVFIGVLGKNLEADENKGIFKTSDGGKSWKKVLSVNLQTGVNQIIKIPNEPILYACAWNFSLSVSESTPYGAESAIYKSEDNGESWKKITQNNGFLSGDFIGKIRISAFDKNTLYALVDNRSEKTLTDSLSSSYKNKKSVYFSANDLETISKSDFLNIENQKIDLFLYAIGQEKKYSAENLKKMVANDIASPSKLLSFLEIKPKEIIGAEVYRSENGGISWEKTHSTPLNDVFFQNGDKFGAIFVNPADKNHLFIGGHLLLESADGGNSWKNNSDFSLKNNCYQVDFQQHTLFTLTQKGLEISYDNGKNWILKNIADLSDFTKIAYNKSKNKLYFVSNRGIFTKNNASWNKISQENQFFTANSSYIGTEFGNFYDFNEEKNELTPLGSVYVGENKAPLRFSKQPPFLISSHNNDILYMGSNKLHISYNKGKQWQTISDNLTNGDKKGNLPYGTLSCIAESPLIFGLLYSGSDDGMIYHSANNGVSWKMIYNSFPKPLKINNLIASKHTGLRVITSLIHSDETTGESYLFLSNDLGKSWSNIAENLPQSLILCVKEDPKNPQILYVGTDNGLYISFNLGESWHPFAKMPQTAISDIFIDENSNEMFVTTSKSGIYKTNVGLIQSLKVAITSQNFYPLQEKISYRHSTSWGNRWNQWSDFDIPAVVFEIFSSKENQKINIKIMKEGVELQAFTHQTTEGFNYISYDATISEEGKTAYEKKLQKIFLTPATNGKIYLPKGKYSVLFSAEDGLEEERELTIF